MPLSCVQGGGAQQRGLACSLATTGRTQASSWCQAFGAQHQAMFHTAGGKPWYAAVRKPNRQDGSMEVLKDAASTGWVSLSQPVKLNELGGPHYPMGTTRWLPLPLVVLSFEKLFSHRHCCRHKPQWFCPPSVDSSSVATSPSPAPTGLCSLPRWTPRHAQLPSYQCTGQAGTQ